MGNMSFKVGDRVRIKSLDWYNKNKDKNGNIVFSSKVPHFALCVNVRTVFTKDMVKYCGKVVTIENVWTVNYSIVEGTHRDYFTDEMIEGLVEEEIIDIDDFQDDNEIIDVIDEYVHRLKNNECQINLPEGYQFTDENGNVINAQKIVLEKKSPKTDDIIKWLREHDMTKYIGVIYSGMCSITFDTEKLIKDITEMIGDE